MFKELPHAAYAKTLMDRVEGFPPPKKRKKKKPCPPDTTARSATISFNTKDKDVQQAVMQEAVKDLMNKWGDPL